MQVHYIPPELDESAQVIQRDSEAWVQYQLELHESQWSETKHLTLAICAWNVDQKKPGERQLNEWLQLVQQPDIIAIGLQEVDMSANAMLKVETEESRPWLQRFVYDIVGPNDNGGYVEIGHKQLVGLFLSVFVAKRHMPYLTESTILTQSTGAVGGNVGNKGGIGLSFKLYRTTICLITAHLAAHMGGVDKRNKNFQQLLRMKIGNRLPKQHDRMVLFGDLNYRIVMPYDNVIQAIHDKRWAELLQNDQLCQEMAKPDSVWQGMKQAIPAFAPTYRYNAGTDIYDTSEKRRTPAFTDRVLWWCKEYDDVHFTGADPVEVRSFAHFPLLNVSDHKPISAQLRCSVQAEVTAKKVELGRQLRQVHATLRPEELQPVCVLDAAAIDFALVEPGKMLSKVFSVTNTGRTAFRFTVCSKRLDSAAMPCSAKWLNVRPLSSVLLPGERCQLTVTCCITHQLVEESLPTGGFFKAANVPVPENADLSSFLLPFGVQLALKTDVGTLAVLPVSAQYQPSCFGYSLTGMVCAGQPLREFYSVGPPAQHERPLIPNELWFLVDFITQAVKATNDMFSDANIWTPGKDGEGEYIRNYLDTKNSRLPVDTIKARSAMDSLVVFLQRLTDPVVPGAQRDQLLQAAAQKNKSAVDQIVAALPAVNYNVFKYLGLFVRFIQANASSMQGNAESFVHSLAGATLRPDGDISANVKDFVVAWAQA
eukprot:TRINITY_DN7653_c0_g1_i1.p1 TRINITY_DN7653_c0_g1~~TRINITY_DN7653_c0_g1_i1.p1  ORF type:complete len:709 (+),score=131.61 TRINITY_DN7653_c0_g1_i1:819-2945(+)